MEAMNLEEEGDEGGAGLSGPLSAADLGLSDDALASIGDGNGGGGTDAESGEPLPAELGYGYSQPLAGCYSLGLMGEQLLWKAAQRPPDAHLYYMFTRFSMALNEFDERILARLPPTDSRFRPDVRILEQADHGISVLRVE